MGSKRASKAGEPGLSAGGGEWGGGMEGGGEMVEKSEDGGSGQWRGEVPLSASAQL